MGNGGIDSVTIKGTEPGGLETRMVVRKLAELQKLKKNARYMKAPTFLRLVENIKRDGCLTSTPTIYREEVLSGNHRTEAAIKAGVVEGFCLEILSVLGPDATTEDLSRERAVAIQLAHNAVEGQDDLVILDELYGELPLQEKLYSGITDDMLKIDEVDIASLGSPPPQYQDIILSFLPEDAEAFKELVERFKGTKTKQPDVLVAAYQDFDRFFEAVVKTKTLKNITNTAIAIRAMADLALERIAELESQCEATDAQPSST